MSDNINSSGSVIVNENEVCFDAKGRATIENREANAFIRETLSSSGAIEISAPDRERRLNIICPTNLHCPQRPQR